MINCSRPKLSLWKAEKPKFFPQWNESMVPPLIQATGGTMKKLHVGNSYFL